MALKTHISKDFISLYSIDDKHYYAENGSLYIVPKTEINIILKKFDDNFEKDLPGRISYLKNLATNGTFKLILK
jgi:hypothetical protein